MGWSVICDCGIPWSYSPVLFICFFHGAVVQFGAVVNPWISRNSLNSQFSCVISIKTVDSGSAWETVQILIALLPQKPVDLDLHCFLN